MSKRSFKEVRKEILKVLSDEKEHSYGEIERKANTNWQTVRTHCEDLKLFGLVNIAKENKVRITKQGVEFLKKI